MVGRPRPQPRKVPRTRIFCRGFGANSLHPVEDKELTPAELDTERDAERDEVDGQLEVELAELDGSLDTEVADKLDDGHGDGDLDGDLDGECDGEVDVDFDGDGPVLAELLGAREPLVDGDGVPCLWW